MSEFCDLEFCLILEAGFIAALLVGGEELPAAVSADLEFCLTLGAGFIVALLVGGEEIPAAVSAEDDTAIIFISRSKNFY